MNTGTQRSLSILILFGAIAGGMHLANLSAGPGLNGMAIRADQTPNISAQMLQSAQQIFKDGITAGMPDRNGAPPLPGSPMMRPVNAPIPYQPSGPPPSVAAPGPVVPSEVEVFNASGEMKHGVPRAVVHTSVGDIVIKLDIAHAPKTVKNFMELASGNIEFVDVKTSRRVRRPFYDGLTVHKVVPDSFIQMGCPFGTGRGGPGYTLPDEISPAAKFDRPGVVAMALAREGIKMTNNSNGSQFFITLGPQPKWDGQFTIFGEVESGLDIVRKISRADAGPTDRPIRRVYMTSVEVRDDDSGPTHAPASVAPPPTSHP